MNASRVVDLAGARGGASRRGFLQGAVAAAAWVASGGTVAAAAGGAAGKRPREKALGLLVGTYLGDALGGPVEFQDPKLVAALPDAPRSWAAGEKLDAAGIAATAARVRLRPYAPLRPVPEPYAHWTANAAPGTITDDSRHKLLLLDALRTARDADAWPMTARGLAQTYLDWPAGTPAAAHGEYDAIGREWLTEMRYSARWLLGERDLAQARPPERLWNGLPTCCGQMGLPPVAAIYPGDPERAYLAAYSLAFYDNGWGRDMNAALVAGLAVALDAEVDAAGANAMAAWERVFAAMRRTDPVKYLEVPWTQRSVDRWLDFALEAAGQARGEPAALFARLNDEFSHTTKWEAQVPFTVMFASLAACQYDPLAALELSIEWGHDTDSYAQLLGAFVGALYGPEIFPVELRTTVARRLQLDYGYDLDEQVDLLAELRALGRQRELFTLDS